MLPLCRRLPLPLAQAPLWLLSPASGNAKRARSAQIRGTSARARGCYTRLGSGAVALGSLHTYRTPSLPRGAPRSGRGHCSTPSSSLFTSLRVPGHPPSFPYPAPPPRARLRVREPIRSSFISGTWAGNLHSLGELFLRPPVPH